MPARRREASSPVFALRGAHELEIAGPEGVESAAAVPLRETARRRPVPANGKAGARRLEDRLEAFAIVGSRPAALSPPPQEGLGFLRDQLLDRSPLPIVNPLSIFVHARNTIQPSVLFPCDENNSSEKGFGTERAKTPEGRIGIVARLVREFGLSMKRQRCAGREDLAPQAGLDAVEHALRVAPDDRDRAILAHADVRPSR